MDLKLFYEKAAELIGKMQEAEMMVSLHNLARKTAEPDRKQFLQLLEDSLDQVLGAKADFKRLIPEDRVKQKMKQIKADFSLLADGELYLTAKGYEDYSKGWPSDWVYEYSDDEGVAIIIEEAFLFAHDLLYDCRYDAAIIVYDLILETQIAVQEEEDLGDGFFFLSVAELVFEELLKLDMEQLGLAAIYATYQTQQPEQRAAAIYDYFSYPFLARLKLEDMLAVGREELEDQAEFFQAWISYLKQQSGDLASRLLHEACFFHEGTSGLVKAARNSYQDHPSLFLLALSAYEEQKDYSTMVDLGQEALASLDPDLKIRATIALKTSQAASFLNKQELQHKCWYEAFYSDSTVYNYLRLFSDPAATVLYLELAKSRIGQLDKTSQSFSLPESELAKNTLSLFSQKQLCFFTGDFVKVKDSFMAKKKALGWTGDFIEHGVDLFLLLLMDYEQLTQASQALAERVSSQLGVIEDQADKGKAAVFWSWFKHWKAAHPLADEERKFYLIWLENLIEQRIKAIVSGKFTRKYASVALLAASLGDIQASWGLPDARFQTINKYQTRYPRHSAFRRELRAYLD